ncbi:MAG: hypothetical protein HW397_188 [Dehalococcoidia bacterium]|nr:hypothetical protein [Dehalococcoidia bacterium]
MARQHAAKASLPQLTQEELSRGFFRLVAEEVRLGEVQPFLHRVKAVPSVSAPYLVGHLVSGGPREREVAAMLLQLLAGPRVIVPLRDVIRDGSAPDEARAAAAMVLERLGEPLGLDALASGLRDPIGVFDRIWETVLGRCMEEEAFLEGLLQTMDEAPADEREDLIRSLTEPRDTRALRLLRPLLYSRRSGTVIAAVEAIEALCAIEATNILREVAEHDPSPNVRKRARAAYGRLFMMSAPQLPGFDLPTQATRQAATERPLPLHSALLTLVDGRGDQGVVIARRRLDGTLKVLSLIVNDTVGIKRCLGADAVREEELSDIEHQLRAEGLTPVEVGIEVCGRVVDEARKLQLSLRQRPPMELEIWRGLIGSPSRANGPAASSPEHGRSSDQDGQLLSLLPEMGSAGEATLSELVTVAVRDLFPEPSRRIWTRRLRRQAWLLGMLGKATEARLTASAAIGMDPVTGVPLELHPFARAMVLASLCNAGLRPPQGSRTS